MIGEQEAWTPITWEKPPEPQCRRSPIGIAPKPRFATNIFPRHGIPMTCRSKSRRRYIASPNQIASTLWCHRWSALMIVRCQTHNFNGHFPGKMGLGGWQWIFFLFVLNPCILLGQVNTSILLDVTESQQDFLSRSSPSSSINPHHTTLDPTLNFLTPTFSSMLVISGPRVCLESTNLC